MKILITTDCYLFNTGGITGSVLALCSGLRRLGHQVKTLSSSNCGRSFSDGDDFYLKSIPAFYYPDMRTSFAVRDPLIKELEEWGPDIVHIQTEGTARRMGLRIAKRCGGSVVMTCHTDYGHYVFGKYKSSPAVRGLSRIAGKILYRRSDRVVAPSEKAASFPFLDSVRDRTSVVPNGLETEKYQKHLPPDERRAFRESLGIGERTGALLILSRLSKEKNVRELISYLPGLLKVDPDIKLLVVGDGPDKKNLERLTEKLKLEDHVVFTGKIPAGDVWLYYDASDLFVSASTFEVHSMSYLEALANGLPLLCRADEALSGVLEHGENGMIYRTEAEFSDFVLRILRDEDMRADMRRRSLRTAEGFSSGAFADAMIKVYEDALAGYKNRDANGKR